MKHDALGFRDHTPKVGLNLFGRSWPNIRYFSGLFHPPVCSTTVKVEEFTGGAADPCEHSSPMVSPQLTPRRAELKRLAAPEAVEQLTQVDPETVLTAPTGFPSQWTIIKAAAAVAPLWFLAQLCFNASLLLTSVSSNTILSSSSSLFTFCMSVVFLGEVFTPSKLIAVLLTVLGRPPLRGLVRKQCFIL